MAEPQAAPALPTAKRHWEADFYKKFKASVLAADDEVDQYIKFANSEIDVEDIYTFWRAKVTNKFPPYN